MMYWIGLMWKVFVVFDGLLFSKICVCIVYVPFRYFSPYEYFVISLPETPHVPIPTRPFTFSGDAKMLLIFICPDFFVVLAVKLSHLFLSCSRSSSSTLKRCCFFCFFFFKYSLLFGRCRLKTNWNSTINWQFNNHFCDPFTWTLKHLLDWWEHFIAHHTLF